MRCYCETFFSLPEILFREEDKAAAAVAGALLPVVRVHVEFHQTINWRLHGECRSQSIRRTAYIELCQCCVTDADTTAFMTPVQHVLDLLKLPDLLSGVRKHDVACVIAEYIFRTLKVLPGDGLLLVELEALIEVVVDLHVDEVTASFELAPVGYDEAGDGEEDRCAVCLEELKPRMELESTPCGHCFHEGCIRQWLKPWRNTCPICRKKVDCTVAAETTVIHI